MRSQTQTRITNLTRRMKTLTVKKKETKKTMRKTKRMMKKMMKRRFVELGDLKLNIGSCFCY